MESDRVRDCEVRRFMLLTHAGGAFALATGWETLPEWQRLTVSSQENFSRRINLEREVLLALLPTCSPFIVRLHLGSREAALDDLSSVLKSSLQLLESLVQEMLMFGMPVLPSLLALQNWINTLSTQRPLSPGNAPA